MEATRGASMTARGGCASKLGDSKASSCQPKCSNAAADGPGPLRSGITVTANTVSKPAVCDAQSSAGAGGSSFLNIINRVRDPLADYQEKRGVPKTESYGFVKLVTSLSQNSYNAILTILTMFYNLIPLLEGFSFALRFALDKLIEILKTDSQSEKIMKIVLFVGEMLIVLLLTIIICGFILFPVFGLFSQFLGKTWSLIFGGV